ncbi:LysR family transcriptional regulator [Caulobacter segnis]|uniref:LysR family transcriptional regulator n=1 Tax=Caulobacter segnis TaxID=88688 RepID=UPI00240FE904|nr:LysR family transcriptional regulator [Caulobacter segnis]MDG2520986.1 LysR family transcriptional regulator [Caulobacter segnis]
MEVFARVVELGGFSAAARSLGMTPSAVSKLMSRLEARLGARLINRSTRSLQLTAEGDAFFQRAVKVLADIAEAEREAGVGAVPRGRVRVNCNIPFGHHYLLPLVPRFLAAYPEVQLDITLIDHVVVDLMQERADVAIRTGPLRESQLIARKLGTSRLSVVASPDYLARHGTPKTLAELEEHNLLAFNFSRILSGWPFLDGEGGNVSTPVAGNLRISDGESLRQLTLAGAGVARLAHFHVGRDIAAGRLVPILEDLNPGDTEEVFAVFIGQDGRLPARVRAFIDFLAQEVRF